MLRLEESGEGEGGRDLQEDGKIVSYSTGYAPGPPSPGWKARGHHRETQGVRKKTEGL